MSKAKIGSPLFILREECAKDLTAVLEKIAQIGYAGVEFLGFFGHKPAGIKNKLDSLGLAAVGNHVAFGDFGENAQNAGKIIDEHKELGCGYITAGAPPDFGENILKTLETFEKIGEKVNAAGMKLLYHNHAGELREKINGKTVLENIFDGARADLLHCELDLGWIGIGGADPAYFLQKYKNRCPVLHFKDYIPTNTDESGFLFRPTGYGVMRNAELYKTSIECDAPPEWYIMDHDCAYGRDPYFDLQISLDYFKNLTIVTQ